VAPLWEPGPSRPLLAAGAAHVWRAQLDTVDDALCQSLSPDERSRARQILGARPRRRWSLSRGLLRAILARYLGTEPEELLLIPQAGGKPLLAVDPAAAPATAPLSFSLSHSGGLALLALSRSPAVGLDVELDRRELDELAVARRAFGPSEAARMGGLGPRERRVAFLRAWARREAVLKMCPPTAHGWAPPWIIDLEVGDSGAAALALALPPNVLCCWEWPPAAGHRVRES
jgi:4'-phosphopantetheinyl transferase